MIRDPTKDAAKDLASKGAEVVAGDMSDPDSLDATLAGADAAFVVVPGNENRTQLGLNALGACKKANVGFVLMLSVLNTDRKGEIFADQFSPVEEATKASGLPFAIARMPLFLENIGAQMQAVKETGKFYTPVEPHKKYNSVSVADLGPACAKILVNANQHHGKTYNLVGSLTTETEFATALSKATGKEVTHVHVPYEACKESFLGMGFPE